MISLDNNGLVRYLTQDEPAQARRAADLIERQLTSRQPGFISTVAMAETTWVLEHAYGFPPAQIATAIERVLACTEIVAEHEQ